MPEVYENEYLTPDQITPELLAGAADETTPRLMRVLDFVERVPRDSEQITIDVIIEQYDGIAEIAGFSDSSKLVKGMELTSRTINPFDVKNAKAFYATARNGEVVRSGGGFSVSQAAIASAMQYLEQRRFNLMRAAVVSVMNDRQFMYADGKKKITIPYIRDIGKLTPPTAKFGGAGFDLTIFLYNLKQEFYDSCGQMPTDIFMSSATGASVIQNSSLKSAFEAAQSSDPENSGRLWDSFSFSGITFNILHEKYPDVNGVLKDAVDAGRFVVAVGDVLGAGPESGSPIKLLSAANNLNAGDSSKAYYDTYSLGEDPWGMALRQYDNMIPALMKKNVIMQMDDVLAP